MSGTLSNPQAPVLLPVKIFLIPEFDKETNNYAARRKFCQDLGISYSHRHYWDLCDERKNGKDSCVITIRWKHEQQKGIPQSLDPNAHSGVCFLRVKMPSGLDDDLTNSAAIEDQHGNLRLNGVTDDVEVSSGRCGYSCTLY